MRPPHNKQLQAIRFTQLEAVKQRRLCKTL